MTSRDWMCLLAAAGNFALAVLSLARGRQSVVAKPLARLCFALFVWNFAALVEHVGTGRSDHTHSFLSVSNAPLWGVVDGIFTALSPPLMLHLIATFVGARRERAPFVIASYVVFGALALSSATGLFSTWGQDWTGSSTWAAAFLAGWVPTLAVALAWLVRHLVEARDHDEKARTRTFLAAFAFGGAFATTDELATLGMTVPRLASFGTLVGTSIVAAAVFRFRLLDRDLSVSNAIYAGALATTGLIAYVVVLRLLGGNVAAFGTATALVTLVLVAAGRELATSRAEQRERVERLTVFGRMAAQMAHDIKNPLAALLGAARVLDDAPPGQSPEEAREFRRLLVDQADRIRVIVDKYERIGRVEPVPTRVQINDVVRRVVGAQRVAAADVSVALDLLDPLPECDVDTDLVASALENVVRNACEAMPGGGALRVTTRVDAPAAGQTTVVVRVEDTGEGMDARRAEQAFEDFFTTKATGSGLGLAFVRRVALAHGGNVSLASRPGEGTAVELRLPTAPPVSS
jgi:two-component system sensor histidine kinase HydH